MNTSKISLVSKLLLFISGLLLIVSIFVPIWRIELDAPQYPEGLKLLIYSNALGGEVEIINGLNHYIGMKTLHAEEFIEFKVLPYIIGFFALFSVVVALAVEILAKYIPFCNPDKLMLFSLVMLLAVKTTFPVMSTMLTLTATSELI